MALWQSSLRCWGWQVAPTARLSRYESSRQVMGTFSTISVYADSEESGKEAIDSAFARISEIESKASIYDTSTEAYRP